MILHFIRQFWSGENLDTRQKKIFAALVIYMPKRVVYCSGGLYAVQWGYYAVQEGYIDVQEDCILFRGAIYCSGVFYTVQEGYMLRKIMMFLVATNVVAS